eukprot:13279424-Alexandrium_andersonii.AAC.1
MEGVEAAFAALGSRALSSPGDGAAALASSGMQGIEAACAVIPRFGQRGERLCAHMRVKKAEKRSAQVPLHARAK